MKRREIKKNMEVLMKSKVKFVSAVGVRLLPSFWACPWFSLSSRSYCVTLGEKKVPPAC